ncbi:hypothetical protein [Halopelagius longus]|nr:hypothetical protein [Halopelagius longus]
MDFFQSLTLWFVIAIFLQTAPENFGGPIGPVIAIIAIPLLYLIPLYVLVGIGAKLVGN